jgi:hypothetical protein
MNVFSFKQPQYVSQQYKQQSPQKGPVWTFEQVVNPTDYDTLARRIPKDLVQRNVANGSGYASHWFVTPAKKLENNNRAIEPMSPSTPKDTNPSTQVIWLSGRTRELQHSQEFLYRFMFEELVGASELNRIEKQYKMKQRKNNGRRSKITIAELIE